MCSFRSRICHLRVKIKRLKNIYIIFEASFDKGLKLYKFIYNGSIFFKVDFMIGSVSLTSNEYIYYRDKNDCKNDTIYYSLAKQHLNTLASKYFNCQLAF